ncbi:DUF7033 domain-containing protein [Croceiramulus getboli]|nr:hypothetical protein P8624_07340 [Flavobacteriaceae bacterium YJPT1-3]
MLLIYSHKITPRLSYVFKQVCIRILGIPVSFTDKVEEFITHDSLKLSYTHKALGNELHLRSSEILFDRGITDLDIQVKSWQDSVGFFPTSKESMLPYDIFGAAFYLLSRYEELLPHVKKVADHYPAEESLAFKHDFLKTPVIDQWAFYFLEALKARFPDYAYSGRQSSLQPIIEVEKAFNYFKVGFMRSLGGFIRDFSRLRLGKMLIRFQTVLRFRKDPYDTFSWLINVKKSTAIRFVVLFQLGDYSTFTKNIRSTKNTFRSLIKMVADYCTVGLLASKESRDSTAQLQQEKKRLERIINRPLDAVKTVDHALTLPENYLQFIEIEARRDFTMGYLHHAGFRAGTCTPFQYFDITTNATTPLLIYPLALRTDHLRLNQKSTTLDRSLITGLKNSVEAVGGCFVMSFTNVDFAHYEWRELFKDLVHDEL